MHTEEKKTVAQYLPLQRKLRQKTKPKGESYQSLIPKKKTKLRWAQQVLPNSPSSSPSSLLFSPILWSFLPFQMVVLLLFKERDGRWGRQWETAVAVTVRHCWLRSVEKMGFLLKGFCEERKGNVSLSPPIGRGPTLFLFSCLFP